MLNDNLIRVVFWHNGEKKGFDWDHRTPEEIRMILQCGVITHSFNDDTEINRPYRITGSSYNLMGKNCRQEVNIYLEEIIENVEFYRTRGL